jgi:miniconductance mechanosensitive channel
MILQDSTTTDPSLWNRLADHPLFNSILGVVLLLLAAFVVDRIVQRLLASVIKPLIRRTKSKWDDALVHHKVLAKTAHLAPALLIYYGITLIPGLSEGLTQAVQRIVGAVIILLAANAIASAVTATGAIASKLAQGRPLKAYFQVVNILVYLVAAILFVAELFDKSPVVLLSGVGATTAILGFVFRDTILSFVASLQITWYDMVRVGDWIEVPNMGADGDVTQVNLLTVMVQNWDKTVTTVPTSQLTSGSFKNWRFMSGSGGRRIKRALYVDMDSIRFLSDEDIDRFDKFDLLTGYIDKKKKALAKYNAKVKGTDVVSNVRRLTNVGTYRAYIEAYLKQDSKIHHTGFTLMVRQLAPTPQGIPLEIYAFTNDTNWTNYEGIQADIFDHMLAIAPEFGIEVFQAPSGEDVRTIGGGQRGAAEGGRGQ